MVYYIISDKKKEVNKKNKIGKIKANPEDINNIIGHKKENAEKLKENYDVEIVVKPDLNIKKGKFELEIEKTYDDLLDEMRK